MVRMCLCDVVRLVMDAWAQLGHSGIIQVDKITASSWDGCLPASVMKSQMWHVAADAGLPRERVVYNHELYGLTSGYRNAAGIYVVGF